MSELLRISGLWGGYKEGVDILRGIDMTVNEGEAVGIIATLELHAMPDL